MPTTRSPPVLAMIWYATVMAAPLFDNAGVAYGKHRLCRAVKPDRFCASGGPVRTVKMVWPGVCPAGFVRPGAEERAVRNSVKTVRLKCKTERRNADALVRNEPAGRTCLGETSIFERFRVRCGRGRPRSFRQRLRGT